MSSFPASQTFRKDRRVTPTLMVVYQFMFEHADLHEVREFKADWVSAAIHEQDRQEGSRHAGLPRTGKISRENVERSLSTLIRWGYLIEHDKQADRPRKITLAHSVRAELRIAS